MLLSQQSYAIKNQLGHWGFGTGMGVFYLLSPDLYGIRIVGFHVGKVPIYRRPKARKLILFINFPAVLVIIGLFYVLLVVKLLLVLCSFRPYGKIRSGEEQTLLLDRRMRESELNYLGLRCIVPCTNDEAAIKAFKDIAGEAGGGNSQD